MMELYKKFIEILRNPVCDNCLGRTCGSLLSGYSNDQRGKMIRSYVALALDSGEKIEIDSSNFHGFKFRNYKPKTGKKECYICKNFFEEKIESVVKEIVKKTSKFEFNDFLIGSIPTNEMLKHEEKIWEEIGAENIELMKAEINREVGKRVEKEIKKSFNSDNPDIIVLIDLKKDEITLRVNSLFVAGGYKKFVRGIPQTRWICLDCHGKGCVKCKGEGKMYKTSVHEIIGKPLCKASDGKDHAFHGSGREDIDARCLDFRPFVLEVIKPKKRSIDLKKLQKEINKSKKVNVSKLEFSDKKYVRSIKNGGHDKTYSADVDFDSELDRKLLPKIKTLAGKTIKQQTPTRVKHRRADILRKRGVREISYTILGKKKLRIKVKGESGLYIKELIHGDGGRTKPSIAELLNSNVEKIVLDVLKIHKEKSK